MKDCRKVSGSHSAVENSSTKNASNRQKALDKPYAVLVLCWGCNGLATDKGTWSEAAQLKCLKESRPEDYDLVAYNHLVNPRAPNRLEPFEIDEA